MKLIKQAEQFIEYLMKNKEEVYDTYDVDIVVRGRLNNVEDSSLKKIGIEKRVDLMNMILYLMHRGIVINYDEYYVDDMEDENDRKYCIKINTFEIEDYMESK